MSIKADRAKANDGLASALLLVFLDSARNLPVSPSERALVTETHGGFHSQTLPLLSSFLAALSPLFFYRHGNT